MLLSGTKVHNLGLKRIGVLETVVWLVIRDIGFILEFVFCH